MNDRRKHRRIIVPRYGGPDALQVLEEERPEPMPGEVLVKVLAAGVSLPDIMMREGIHPETHLPSPSRQAGIWLVWWNGSATVSLD